MGAARQDPGTGGPPTAGGGGRRPPASVYRRRRLVALLLAVVLLALLAWGVTALVGAVGGALDEGAAAAQAEPSPAPTLPEQPGGCTADDLEVSVAAPGEAAAGAAVLFTLTIANAGQEPCLVDAGRASLAVTVHSGGERVWSSADCRTSPAERLLLLGAGDTSRTEISWSGERSDAGCSDGLGGVDAGTYQASGSLAGAGPATAEHTLVLE